MIPEPQKAYVLELLAALGTAADDFVVAGAQAMKFSVKRARGTKDVDFILNVIALRKDPLRLATILENLGYKPVPESRNFQFEKPIPDSTETMRIEFMAPEEFKRRQDFRVDIQEGVHARACTGGSIALAQSDTHSISGKLPNGSPFTGQIRVTRPHALVMLKLLALRERRTTVKIEALESPRYLGTDMADKHVDVRTTLRKPLGATRPPDTLTQEAYEHRDRHLRRLLRLESGEPPNGNDLLAYMEDLRYTEIQTSLFVHLLPICLEVWRNDLRGVDSSYGVVEHFYPILADRHVFDAHLTPKQAVIVSDFMRQVILEEIDEQRGLAFQGSRARPYRWVGELTTYGVLLPDLEPLWTEWWALRTVGRAVAAIQYISCLMYSENENPVFAPWTPNGGGGPPCLWEFEGHLYEHRWLEPNVSFLRKTLSVDSVSNLLSLAVSHLVGEPEHRVATLVQEDFPLCEATVETRCAALPQLLETKQEPGKLFEWPTKAS